MIKFRYKRKEPASNATNSSNCNSLTKNSSNNNNNKNVEIKSIESKNDNKLNSLKRETKTAAATATTATAPSKANKIDEIKLAQTIKTKTSSEQEYLEDCIRAVVVSIFYKSFRNIRNANKRFKIIKLSYFKRRLSHCTCV